MSALSRDASQGLDSKQDHFESDSNKFNIGQTGCVKLPVAGMTDGTPYTVYFSAVFGSQYVNCTPEPPPYESNKDANLTYQATGAVRTVHCKR